MDFAALFDRVVVINLARRQDRLERFWQSWGHWPFKRPERFEAIDGHAIPTPPGWNLGPGAWGCMLSHRAVVDQAIRDGVQSLLILEDDACPCENFAVRAPEFLEKVPDDWDCLMLGAQHLLPPVDVSPGIVRCACANRAHAYAVRGAFMKTLLQLWQRIDNHCDVVLASTMKRFKAYAPNPLLIGQAAGPSDISGLNEPKRFWCVEDEAERLLLVRELLTKVSKMKVMQGNSSRETLNSIHGAR